MYITQYILKILYNPLVGENSIDIMTPNRPQGYENLNKIERMFVSNFMLTIDPNTNEITKRLPLSFTYSNLIPMLYGDTRIGGFGPFFMEISLLAGISILHLLTLKNVDKAVKYKLLFYCCTIFFLVLILPESWWARYVPLLYIIPVIITIPYFMKLKYLPFIVELLTFFLIINNLYIAVIYFDNQIKFTKQINQTLEELKNNNEKVYVYKYGEFHNNVQKLKENNIEYEIIEDKERWDSLGEEKRLFLANSIIVKLNRK